MEDCIFCMLANGQIPTDMVYEDELCACFRDASPQAPVHMLLVPKKHIGSLNELECGDAELIAHMMLKIKEIAASEGLDNGYRCVINTGEDGGQTVPHLHIHILGKRSLLWPPG
ncbi:MAG: histidine triad nucleotide-binding protein [Firmicutes bacterium]|nr:histidine triad nucleotide-binding protein [Bacillota bacterium]